LDEAGSGTGSGGPRGRGIVRAVLAVLALVPAAHLAAIGHEWLYFGFREVEGLLREGPLRGIYGPAILRGTLGFLLGMVAVAGIVAVLLHRRGLPARRAIGDGALHLLPLAINGPLLFLDHVGTRLVLHAAVVAATAAAIAYRTLPDATEPASDAFRATRRLAAVAVLAAFAGHAALSVMRHLAYWSSVIDLGLFSGAVRSTARGGAFLFAPELGVSFLAEHFSPILVVFVPFYAVFDDPIVLLVGQAAAAAAGGWLLYRLAEDLLGDGRPALAVCVSYLVAPDMFQAHWHDFHIDLLMPPMIFGAILALRRSRAGWFLVCVLLLWLTKEEAVVYTFLLGLYAWAVHRRRWLGLGVAAASVGVGLAVVGWVLPAFGRTQVQGAFFRKYAGGYAFADRYAHLGKGFWEMAKTAATNPFYVVGHLVSPDPLGSAVTVTAPLGFAALFGGAAGLLLLAGCLVMFLASYAPMASLTFYYGAVPLALAYAAALHGLARIHGRVRRLDPEGNAARRFRVAVAAYAAAAALMLLYVHPDVPFSPANDRPAYLRTAHGEALDEIAAEIPEDAPVAATGYAGVHFMNRPRIRMIPYGLDDAEWIVIDLYRPAWPSSPGALAGMVERYLADPNWGLVRAERGVFVFRRGAPPGETDLARFVLLNPLIEVEEWETSAFANLAVRAGGASGGWALEVTPADRRGPGHLFDGPGLPLGPGGYEAHFRLAIRPEPGCPRARTAVTLDVARDREPLASREIRFNDIEADGRWHDVVLPFRWIRPGAHDFRVFYHDSGTVVLDRIGVRRIAE
jgi:uncharacterized membrane protein